MQKFTVGAADEGGRLDKYLQKLLKEADKGFLYKMLRKKNITLNGKKAEGAEKLKSGDEICLFFSEETFEKFRGNDTAAANRRPADRNAAVLNRLPAGGNAAPSADPSLVKVVFEDEQLLIVNKPAGMLSQKAAPGDVSLCEHICAYLKEKGEADSPVFTAGVANRLDRNTSGLVLAGKTLAGQQLLAYLLRKRLLDKYYRCIVKGTLPMNLHSKLYWTKNEESNMALISDKPAPGAEVIELEIKTLARLDEGFSLLRVKLITGKSHQIRAQLAHLGFPVLGDAKYGDGKINRTFAAENHYTLRHQLLHAAELFIPAPSEDELKASGLPEAALKEWKTLAGQSFTAALPANFRACLHFLGGDSHVG